MGRIFKVDQNPTIGHSTSDRVTALPCRSPSRHRDGHSGEVRSAPRVCSHKVESIIDLGDVVHIGSVISNQRPLDVPMNEVCTHRAPDLMLHRSLVAVVRSEHQTPYTGTNLSNHRTVNRALSIGGHLPGCQNWSHIPPIYL